MRQSVISWTLGSILVGAVAYWIASNTEWVDVTLPMPPAG